MAKIPLSKGLFAHVDARDVEWLSQWKWHASNCARSRWEPRYYAKRKQGGRTIYMHREIMIRYFSELEPGWHVDHGDGDSLNNRLENLWYVTARQNAANRAKDGNNER